MPSCCQPSPRDCSHFSGVVSSRSACCSSAAPRELNHSQSMPVVTAPPYTGGIPSSQAVACCGESCGAVSSPRRSRRRCCIRSSWAFSRSQAGNAPAPSGSPCRSKSSRPAPALRANARSSRGNAPAGTTPSRPPARLSENVGCSAMLPVYSTAPRFVNLCGGDGLRYCPSTA